MYDPETYKINKDKIDYYKARYYANKQYIVCDICKVYKTKRNYDLNRHKKLKHSV